MDQGSNLSHWNKEDYTKVIDFLNMVANKATFSFNTQETIEYFRLLNYMQVTILNKIKESQVSDTKVYSKDELQQAKKSKK